MNENEGNISIGDSVEAPAHALAERMRNLAQRLDVKPCDPNTVIGGILVRSNGGPVYDLLDILNALLDRMK